MTGSAVASPSQAPWETTKCTYRPCDFDRLIEALGVDPSGAAVEPDIAEDFVLSFRNETTADDMMSRIS